MTPLSSSSSSARAPSSPNSAWAALAWELLGSIGRDGRLGAVNQAWERALEFSASELLLTRFIERIHPEDVLRTESALHAAACQPTWVAQVESRLRARDGSYRPVAWRVSAAPHGGWNVAGQDLSELRRAEKQLLQSQAASQLGRLAMGIAHDFNSVLSVILGCTGMLESARTLDPRLAREAKDIHEAAERGRDLVRALLDLCRGREPERHGNVDEAARRIEPLLRRLLQRNIRLELSLSAGLSPVKLDSSSLDQILLNLTVNARDAMPEGGRLTISTALVSAGESARADVVLLTVADTGTGMTPEVQERILEPFFTTKGGNGSGIGLATVAELVRAAGGRLQVRSQPGEGSSFQLHLPAASAPAKLY